MKQSKARQRIVETASALFYANGYNLTGINEIIKEAGVAKATLYAHFSSKEEICIAYLHHKDDVFQTKLLAFLDEYSNAKEKILGLFDFLDNFFSDGDFNGCWCINTVSELPKENEKVRTVIQGQKKGLIRLIAGLVEELPSETKREGLAGKIYLLYEGAIAESHLHRDSWPIGSARDICSELIQ